MEGKPEEVRRDAPSARPRLALGLALLLAGCGSDDSTSTSSSSSPSPTDGSSVTEPASADVCAARDQLVTDVRSMKDDNVQEFKTDFTAAKKDFEELRSVAEATYSDDLDNFETALSDFADALSSFGSEGAMQGLEKLGKAAGELDDAAATLAEEIPCPSA